MAQPAKKLLQRHQQLTHRSLGMRPRLDYTHCVMLNDCVSAPWSPMYQYLALTSLRDSHPFPTRHIREPGTDRRLFFTLLYFHFRTSVSILRFLHFSVFHLPHSNVQFPGITSQTLTHNACLMLVAQTVSNRTPPTNTQCLFFSADSMLSGFCVLFCVDHTLVTQIVSNNLNDKQCPLKPAQGS